MAVPKGEVAYSPKEARDIAAKFGEYNGQRDGGTTFILCVSRGPCCDQGTGIGWRKGQRSF